MLPLWNMNIENIHNSQFHVKQNERKKIHRQLIMWRAILPRISYCAIGNDENVHAYTANESETKMCELSDIDISTRNTPVYCINVIWNSAFCCRHHRLTGEISIVSPTHNFIDGCCCWLFNMMEFNATVFTLFSREWKAIRAWKYNFHHKVHWHVFLFIFNFLPRSYAHLIYFK